MKHKEKMELMKKLYGNAKEVVPTERQEHLAFVQWANLNPWREDLIHIANEYDGGAIKGRIRKLMGVRKGVSDFFLAIPKNGKHGFWIELKRTGLGSHVTIDQRRFLERMKAVGFETKVCYGCDDAIQSVKNYLHLP